MSVSQLLFHPLLLNSECREQMGDMGAAERAGRGAFVIGSSRETGGREGRDMHIAVIRIHTAT